MPKRCTALERSAARTQAMAWPAASPHRARPRRRLRDCSGRSAAREEHHKAWDSMKKAATPAVDVVQEDARQIAPDLLSFTSRIVKAYVARNALSAGELPAIIGSVHASLLELGQAAAIDHPALRPTQNPAVPISKSVTPKFIVCLEDGKRLRTM